MQEIIALSIKIILFISAVPIVSFLIRKCIFMYKKCISMYKSIKVIEESLGEKRNDKEKQ